MRRGSLFFRILPLLLAISTSTLFGVSAVAFFALRSLYYDANRYILAEAVRSLANGIPPKALESREAAQAYCVLAAKGTSFRATLIAPDGVVLGDSRADSTKMENHGDRSEIQGALGGKTSFDMRTSATLGVQMLYASTPLQGTGGVRGVLRIALFVPDLQARMAPIYASAAAAALLLLGAMALVSVRLGERVSRPVASLAETAQSWAGGDFRRRVGKLDPAELDRLGHTMNAMAAELSQRIAQDAQRTRELQTILDSTSEAVIAVDEEFRVRRVNPAARLLSVAGPDDPITGLSLLEAFRSTEMQAATERCASSRERIEAELTLYQDSIRHFLLYASPLTAGEEQAQGGVVLVINDITRMRRLEQIRRDFVANVSHELKTPITLIKGFVETLQDGAIRDPREADRFLEIVGRHAQRMDSLIDDLLTLAKLERPDAPPLRREPTLIREVLQNIASLLESKRQERGSTLSVDCPEGLIAPINEGLLEQAILNLAENAIKYSGRGAFVVISAAESEGFLEIRVRDNGPGIPSKHLPRIFERFYRVDKARSREEGGTGLGLAIVRHIALAHGGEAEVESKEGVGSVFTIRLPMEQAATVEDTPTPGS